MLGFYLPTDQHRNDVLSFYGEFKNMSETCIGYASYEDFDKWLCGMKNRISGTNLPAGWVRENFYLCYDADELVGVFSLKMELTAFLLNFGGHVGYAVKPSTRNRGYATQILKQGLQIAGALGFEKVLAVCDEDNRASEKVILHNGGIFENTLFDADENVSVKRYWLKTLSQGDVI